MNPEIIEQQKFGAPTAKGRDMIREIFEAEMAKCAMIDDMRNQLADAARQAGIDGDDPTALALRHFLERKHQ